MWNLLKLIPKMRFWQILAKMMVLLGQIWVKFVKKPIGVIFHPKVVFLKYGVSLPKFYFLAIWPNWLLSKFKLGAFKCVKFWKCHVLIQLYPILFKIRPTIHTGPAGYLSAIYPHVMNVHNTYGRCYSMSMDTKKSLVTLLSNSHPSQGSKMSHGVTKKWSFYVFDNFYENWLRSSQDEYFLMGLL